MPLTDTSDAPAAALPEVLAPAGDWECVHAAVENGADGIYFGLERFNARMRARNFTADDLPALMEYLHRRGVRGYVTFNTLVFADELAEAEDYLRRIIAAGVDAAIVQDVGICRLIRALSPDFPIHCSTQMTITSTAGTAFARELGASLVVLARENSLREIAAIQAGGPPVRLEVFVHGALCVAYSGQCLTSEALGGRSANRGECAQACRLPYELLADGKRVDLGDRRYLLSPRDLASLDVIPELIRLGVASLKIEGRLKSPEYVAAITRAYREAVDRLAAASPAGEAAVVDGLHRDHDYPMAMAFTRGFHTGWFRGTDNQELVHARFGTKRGVFLGEVARVEADRVALRLAAPLKPGDGVVFDAGRPDEKEEGGRVYQVEPRGAETLLGFGRGDVDFRRVRPGDRLWKTSDPALEKRIRLTFEGEEIRHRRPIAIAAHGRAGQPLRLDADDGAGHAASVESAIPLAQAQTQPLTLERLRAQAGRLGGTPFALGSFASDVEEGVMLPLSELNRMRRALVAGLEAMRARPPAWILNPAPAAAALAGDSPAAPPPPPPEEGFELIALVRSPAQMEAAWEAGARTLYCEFEDPRRYREAVRRFRELQAGDQAASIWAAPPRIFKPGEEWILRQVLSCEADGYLARNYDHLGFFRGRRLRGDYSLNVANRFSAGYLLRRYGLERVTASYDLNIAQLEGLLRGAPTAWFEITLHQHMPLFHMEHCVFCAFLSSGHDYRDCGRPCDRHEVRLRDRVGAELPLKADAGCRNTVFNNRAQTGAEFAGRLQALGARAFRVEFLFEPPEEVGRTVRRYRQLLAGEASGAELWREFKLLNQIGVTRGQMEGAAR